MALTRDKLPVSPADTPTDVSAAPTFGENHAEEDGAETPVCTRTSCAHASLGLLLLVGLIVAAEVTGLAAWLSDTIMVKGPAVVSWVHDHPGYVTLLMAAVTLLDTIPGIGHLLAKPLQYALPWIFG
jgi:hypothetical protein